MLSSWSDVSRSATVMIVEIVPFELATGSSIGEILGEPEERESEVNIVVEMRRPDVS